MDALDFVNDAAAAEIPSDDKLKSLAGLIAERAELESEMESLSRRFEQRKIRYDELNEKLIPGKMQDIGVKMLLVGDDFVEVETEVYASVPAKDEAKKQVAFKWLRDNHHADLIKNELKASFGRGAEKEATAALDALSVLGVSASLKESVNPQTLSAFVREQRAKGIDLPADVLGIHVETVAKVTKVKK